MNKRTADLLAQFNHAVSRKRRGRAHRRLAQLRSRLTLNHWGTLARVLATPPEER